MTILLARALSNGMVNVALCSRLLAGAPLVADLASLTGLAEELG
jgi:hypothetical protein